jgi:hypothetical protein
MKSKYFIVQVPIFDWEILVSKQEPDEALFKRIEKQGYERGDFSDDLSLDKHDYGVTAIVSKKLIVIRLQKWNDRTELKKLIIHESHHAADFILTNIGMKFMMNVSDEAFTYLQDFICGEIFRELKI